MRSPLPCALLPCAPLPHPLSHLVHLPSLLVAVFLLQAICHTLELSPSLLLFSEFQAAIANGAPLSAEVACCVIEDADARVAHADRQRDEAEARKRVIFESYNKLNGKKVR
jgi:hypothetical protein